MKTNNKPFDERDIDFLYQQYQSSRAGQLPNNYLKTLFSRKQQTNETSTSEDISEVSETYREYITTRGTRDEQGIERIMTEVHVHLQNMETEMSKAEIGHQVEPENLSIRQQSTGVGNQVREWLSNTWQRFLAPAWGIPLGAAALIMLAILPFVSSYLGTGPDDHLAFAPSPTTSEQSGIISAQISESESSSLGYAGGSTDTQAFQSGTASVDLLMASRIQDVKQKLLVLRNLQKLQSRDSQPEVTKQILSDIHLLSDTSQHQSYNPEPVLKLLRKTYDNNQYKQAYESGQWIETLILEATLASQTKDNQRIVELISESSTTEQLLLLVQNSNAPPRILRQLQEALTKPPLDLNSVNKISKLAQDLKYVY